MLHTTNLDKYIKDSMIFGKVTRFSKKNIYIYISPISSPIEQAKKENYYYIIKQAAYTWNKYAPVKFDFTETTVNADIIINWTKVGIKFEGNCKFRSIIASEIKAITIEIGLPNPNSPKIINNETILHTVMHELGHAMGLGHGTEENDIMFVPHKKTLCAPSQNDLYVLNVLYSNSIGTLFINIKK